MLNFTTICGHDECSAGEPCVVWGADRCVVRALDRALGYEVPAQLLVEFFADWPLDQWELAEYDEHQWWRSTVEHHIELADAWDSTMTRLYAEREAAENAVVRAHQLVGAYELAAKRDLV